MGPRTTATGKSSRTGWRFHRRFRVLCGIRAESGNERGTAVVEFALIAPLLFLLVFGVVDFGRALNYYNDLTQLAGQGARAAAVSRNPDGSTINGTGSLVSNCDSRTDSIQCLLVSYYTTTGELKNGISVCLGVMDSAGNISSSATALPAPGAPVTVRATYTFQFLPIVKAGSIRLTATQTERSEVASPTYTPGADRWNGTQAVSGGDACGP